MDIIALFSSILHVDQYLSQLVQTYGFATHLILFLIILAETGLVLTPFLPGDSLLFIAGAFAAQGSLNLWILLVLLTIAAIAGDSLNYFIGHKFGQRLKKYVKQEYIQKTEDFYHKHGGKTIIMARFIPIVRTFAPFVAGIGAMHYPRFIFYNIIGGIAWVALFLFAGYFFGGLPVIEENLTLVIFIIIGLSFLPPIIEYIKHKLFSKK